MSLKTDLQEIQGVGEKTAEKIIAVVEESEYGNQDIEEAISYLEAGHVETGIRKLKE